MDAVAAARRFVLLLSIGSIARQLAAAVDCPVQYSPEASDLPLLYGGYYSACKGPTCQPRDSIWGDSCKLDPDAYTAWGVCENWQRPQPFAVAQQLSSGAIERLSPCDLFGVLGNRTLWIVGDSHAKVLYYSLRCFSMDFWDHAQGECAASSNSVLQKKLELASAQVLTGRAAAAAAPSSSPAAPSERAAEGCTSRFALRLQGNRAARIPPTACDKTRLGPLRQCRTCIGIKHEHPVAKPPADSPETQCCLGLLHCLLLQGHPYNNPPRCLHFSASHARICVIHNPIGTYLVSNEAENPGTLQLLHDHFAAPDDVVYVGFGHWHANNCEGIHPSYAPALENFGAYLESVRATMPNVLYSVAPHEHTKCTGNAFDFNTPTCLPPEEGGYNTSIGLEIVRMAHNILGKYDIPVIDSYNISLALYNSHVTPAQSIVGIIDCLHFCRPSLAEIDIWKIYTIMLAQKPARAQGEAAVSTAHMCVQIEPLLYRPHGPLNDSSVHTYSKDTPMPMWEQDAWGYPYPTNR